MPRKSNASVREDPKPEGAFAAVLGSMDMLTERANGLANRLEFIANRVLGPGEGGEKEEEAQDSRKDLFTGIEDRTTEQALALTRIELALGRFDSFV